MASSQSTIIPRLTESGLARKLGVSRQAVHELVKPGILTKDKDGLIDVELAEHALMNRVRPSGKTATALQGTPPQSEAPATQEQNSADPEITSYHVAKTLREATEAQIARLRLAEMQGDLIRVDAIRSALAGMIASTRDSLLQIPARVSPVLAVETDAARVHDMLQAELHQALAQLVSAPAKITRLEAGN